MAVSFIGLGGNVGDVIANMASALRSFDKRTDTNVLSVSKVYKTPPWGIEDQDWFHNACAKLSTSLQPNELLEECLRIEKLHLRERKVRWGPRTLDLDILVYEDQRIELDDLTIPHPRMHERSFVMKPLADIAPETTISGKTPAEWVQYIADDDLEALTLPSDWWRNYGVT